MILVAPIFRGLKNETVVVTYVLIILVAPIFRGLKNFNPHRLLKV